MLGKYSIKPAYPQLGQLVQEPPYDPIFKLDILGTDTSPTPEVIVPYRLPEPEAEPDIVDAVDTSVTDEHIKAGLFPGLPISWKKIVTIGAIGVAGYFFLKWMMVGAVTGAAYGIAKKGGKRLKKQVKKTEKKLRKKGQKMLGSAKKKLKSYLNPELLIINPYGKKAKYFHLRVRDPRKFDQKYIRTIDPGEPGKIKVTIGRPKGSRKTTAQSVLVEKAMVPANLHGYFKGLEKTLERKPAGTSWSLAKRVAKKSKSIADQIRSGSAKASRRSA